MFSATDPPARRKLSTAAGKLNITHGKTEYSPLQSWIANRDEIAVGYNRP